MSAIDSINKILKMSGENSQDLFDHFMISHFEKNWKVDFRRWAFDIEHH